MSSDREVLTARATAGVSLADPMQAGPGEPMRPTFRLISAGVPLRTSPPIVIGEQALREALPLFQPGVDVYGMADSVPVRMDHERDSDKVIGRISAARWVEATAEIPAGIEGDLEIDPVLGAKVIRALELRYLRSGSVSIEYQYMVEFTPDDEAVIVVTGISRVREFSIVDSGADPYARRLDAQEGGMSDDVQAAAGVEANTTAVADEVAAVEDLAAPPADEFLPPEPGPLEQLAADFNCEPEIAAVAAKVGQAFDTLEVSLATAERALAETSAKLAAAEARVAELEGKIRADKKRAMLTDALRSGSIEPWEMEGLSELSDAVLSVYLGKRKPRSAVPLGVDAAPVASDLAAPGPEVTEHQRKVAGKLGIDEKVFVRTV